MHKTRKWRRAEAKACSTWIACGFPYPFHGSQLEAEFNKLINWFIRNPSCFWGRMHW